MNALSSHLTLSTGARIPQLGFGTWLLKEGDECYNAVRTALELGYRHIDTARAYDNEASVGRAVKDSGLAREDVFVTSKLPAEAKDEATARRDFETTMREIDLEYLDLYLVHAPWPWDEMGKDCREENKVIWSLMEEWLASGKVKAIGVSNFGIDDLESLLPSVSVVPMANQIRCFVGASQPDLREYCAGKDMAIEAFSPFAHGLIVNHPELMSIAERYNASAPQLCIQYLLQKGTIPLPKATTRAHIEANAALDFAISDDDLATMDAMTETEKHPDAMEFRWD